MSRKTIFCDNDEELDYFQNKDLLKKDYRMSAYIKNNLK